MRTLLRQLKDRNVNADSPGLISTSLVLASAVDGMCVVRSMDVLNEFDLIKSINEQVGMLHLNKKDSCT